MTFLLKGRQGDPAVTAGVCSLHGSRACVQAAMRDRNQEPNSSADVGVFV